MALTYSDIELKSHIDFLWFGELLPPTPVSATD